MNGPGHDRFAADGPTDAALIGESLREPDRFAAIFDRHAPYIHRYLARRLGRELADDLVGETFLVAFRKRRRYDLDQPDARPWLYGIATHLVSQHRREEVRAYRLRQVIRPEPDESCHADRVTDEVVARSVGGRLGTALAELSQGDRDVLLLVAWEEMTYGEVAAALRIPVGTVRSRLSRARRKVRAALGGTNPTATFEEASRNG